MNSDWFGIGGGDGFQTAVDPTDFNIVYTESQDGNTNRYDLRRARQQHPPRRRARRGDRGPGGQARRAAAPLKRPAGQAGGGRGGRQRAERAPDRYRFNWNTPFMLSPHNPSIVWLGGNRLFKSLNRGDTWVASTDLTKQIDRNKVS